MKQFIKWVTQNSVFARISNASKIFGAPIGAITSIIGFKKSLEKKMNCILTKVCQEVKPALILLLIV